MNATYLKTFKSESRAMDVMRLKNRACKAAGNRRDLFAVIPGHEDNWAVIDIRSAIEIGSGYRWEV